MNVKLEQVIEEAKALSTKDRASLAHCLISSLEPERDNDVEAEWSLLAEQRLNELESGKVQGVAWNDIKNKLKITP